MRRDVMYNDFVVLGPKADPAGSRGARTAADAFARIARSGSDFISRGDNSGTHIKEQEIWRKTGLPLESVRASVIVGGEEQRSETLRPRGDWYLSVGQGMGKTITIATERQGYTLADRGTYYAFALAEPARTDLALLCQGDPLLYNPYGVIAVNPAKNPGVNFEAAVKYIEWITSRPVQKMIGGYRVQRKVLFHASASPGEAR
jgi:tungstate transport system substrate-binding protein